MRRYEHGGDIYGNKGIELDFSVNTNPLGLPEEVKRALISGVPDYERYPDPLCRKLTQAIAAHHSVGVENVLCGNGAADMIFRLCACFKPRLAFTLAPTFSEYERPVRLFGGEVAEFALSHENGFAVGEGVLGAIPQNADMVFLCNPNNPTGRLMDHELMLELAQACARRNALLVADECFLPFTAGESMIPYIKRFPNLLVLRAFTKLYAMAGLRLGYLVGEAALLARAAEFAPKWSVSVPAQAAGLAALSAEPVWTAQTRALVAEERAYLAKGLSSLGLTVFPGEANYLLLRCPKPLYEPLRSKGILVRGCANFTGLDESYIRVCVKTRQANDLLLRAIRGVL